LGFTTLSERLARLGKSGAEELTATIDSCFVTLLAECLLASGAGEDALGVADRCLVLAQDLGGVPPQIPQIHRVRGAALPASE
jgi:hypothetical protein